MSELVTRLPIELSWKDKHRIKEIMGIMQAVEGRRRQMIDFRSGLQRLAPSICYSFLLFLGISHPGYKNLTIGRHPQTTGVLWVHEEHVEGFKYEK